MSEIPARRKTTHRPTSQATARGAATWQQRQRECFSLLINAIVSTQPESQSRVEVSHSLDL